MGVKMEDYLFSSGVFPFLAWVATVLEIFFSWSISFRHKSKETEGCPADQLLHSFPLD
jgi:hypothetical protein